MSMDVQRETVSYLGCIAAYQDHSNEKLGEADKKELHATAIPISLSLRHTAYIPVVAVFWLTSQLEHFTYHGTPQLLIDMTFEDENCVVLVNCNGSHL